MEKVYRVEVERTRRGVVYVVASSPEDAKKGARDSLQGCPFSDIEVEQSENRYSSEAVEGPDAVAALSRHAVIETDGSFVEGEWDQVMRERLGMGEVAAEGGAA